MILEALQRVVERKNLTQEEAVLVMDEIMSGKATDVQIAAFLAALRMKGETVEELTGFARVMREKVVPIRAAHEVAAGVSGTERELLVDTAGTGGDARGTFNVSTATAFVAAGAGLTVAKHGNRSVSSLCGSADVIEAMGIHLDITPQQVGRCIDEIGIGFLFAPLLHLAMKYVMVARREMRIRTVFNILGPLTNPAKAGAQILGVYDGNLTEPMAQVLRDLGSKRVFVVHGDDGLDEISNTGRTKVSEVHDGQVKTYYVTPEDFGMQRATMADLQGGDVKDNARIVLDILRGEKGPKRDIVLINSAAALVAGGKAQDFLEGAALARESIDSGAAMGKFEALRALTQSFK
ncbi:MAG: anthranilate phosphoribosyltransferase [Candidatus Tectomicrobia bacterium]|uniref:Anthranilate phosphoribosyltransferase n=1 Tax=Tectimicrobiota bacterium TaxID=2528274 RepID=A0A932M140_UNCTE|nr:anthranilate phosphoribosyltransferase [Candidatus Tectomicrobia bacterium]